MELTPFSPSEMTPRFVEPGFPGCPDRTIFRTPVPLKENLLAAVREKQCWYVPNVLDVKNYQPRIIPDNKARATVFDGFGPFTPNPEGELDAFGVTWLYDPVVNGSMVKPGSPILEDVEDWEEVIRFPDPESWDWDAQAAADAGYFNEPEYAYQFTVFTGFFERLISWMDFEEAAIAMIDEDSQPYVHAMFDKLATLYCSYIDHVCAYAPVTCFEIHDDWGSQKAPFMSYETIEKMVLPYLKRVVEHAHSKGLVVQQHSCGHIEPLIPIMIEAGVDMWMGQALNDKKQLVADYGDRIVIQVELPQLGADAPDDAVRAAAEAWAADFLVPGKPIELSIYGVTPDLPPRMTDYVYELSRKAYCA